MKLSDNLSLLACAAVLLTVLNAPGFISAAPPNSFDVPLTKKVLDFGPSPYYGSGQNIRVKLSCYFYPAFMVKEYDEGEKGAEWLAIVPIEQSSTPNCARSHDSGEMVIDGAEWSGYFKGVKGSLVFFDSADATDGGLPFAIYDSTTGKKAFEDSAYDSRMWNKKATASPFNQLRVTKTSDGQTTLRYLRVVEANCDLHTEKSACWEEVRKTLELRTSQMPICSNYDAISERRVSAVAYPVEVRLFPQPVTKTIEGPVKCWPVD